jgi:hypothetical protein
MSDRSGNQLLDALERRPFPVAYLVGREALLEEAGRAYRGEGRQSVWLYGPRGLGKTTVAEAIRFRAESGGTRVLSVNASDADPFSLEGLGALLIRAGSRRKGSGGGGARARLEALAMSSTKCPVLLVIDNFDRAAAHLDLDGQALLRALAERHRGFAYLFVSREPPSRLLEDVAVVESRLAGICTALAVHALKRHDVRTFVERVARDFAIGELGLRWRKIWESTGGFPVVVVRAVVALAREFSAGTIAGEGAFDDSLAEIGLRLREDCVRAWRGLRPGSQDVLLNRVRAADHVDSLRRDGLFDREQADQTSRPAWIVAVGHERTGCRATPPEEDFNASERIRGIIAEINHATKLRAGKDCFRVSNEMLRAMRRRFEAALR